MALSAAELARIRREVEEVSAPYGIGIYGIDLLPDEAGGGAAVNLLLPEGMAPDHETCIQVRDRLEQIPGVKAVFVVTAVKSQS